MEDLPSGYRPNVGICLINADNQVFVASRLNVPVAWQMPQGGIEDGEDPQAAAIRELGEETGIVSVDIISEVPNWLNYDFPPAVKAKVNRLWGGGEWHGQAQKWQCVVRPSHRNLHFTHLIFHNQIDDLEYVGEVIDGVVQHVLEHSVRRFDPLRNVVEKRV